MLLSISDLVPHLKNTPLGLPSTPMSESMRSRLLVPALKKKKNDFFVRMAASKYILCQYAAPNEHTIEGQGSLDSLLHSPDAEGSSMMG